MSTDITNEALAQDMTTAASPKSDAEIKRAKKIAEKVRQARSFDKTARAQYAIDRRYARGDSGFSVDGNIVGTYIDIMKAFLYAKDPDVDIMPALSTEPPGIDALRDAAEDIVAADPGLQQQAMAQAKTMVMVDPMLPFEMAMQQSLEAVKAEAVKQQFEALQKRFNRRQRDNKGFAETLELVVSRLFKDGKLKPRAKGMVGSALTIGPGWIKGTWQERTSNDPATRTRIDDSRSRIDNIVAKREQMEGESGSDLDAMLEQEQASLQALETERDEIVARGYVIDFVPAEDMTVPPGYSLADYADSPWLDQRIPMRRVEAQATYNLTSEQLAKATSFTEIKPVMKRNESPTMAMEKISESDADRFESTTRLVQADNTEGGDVGEWVMVHETWDRDDGCYYTWIEGMEGFARPEVIPSKTSRFYPFFLFALGELDGQRHPQSLVSRSAKLVDEYYRIGSAEQEHRRRIKPKTVFNAAEVDDENAAKLERATTQEMVGIKTTNPNLALNQILLPVAYAPLDPALYDRSRIISELERIWGIQEALSGSIQTAKTATEAQIMQTGMQARTGAMRDALEDVLQELARYTAEIARVNMDLDDVQQIVGPDAMWPDYDVAQDLSRMVSVDIVAGSSGKPNTTAERQAWASTLPILQGLIQTIGQLRGSTPSDIADAYEELAKITIARSGDRLDVAMLLPQAGPPQPLGMPGMPQGAPPMLPGPGPGAGAPAEPMTAPAPMM